MSQAGERPKSGLKHTATQFACFTLILLTKGETITGHVERGVDEIFVAPNQPASSHRLMVFRVLQRRWKRS